MAPLAGEHGDLGRSFRLLLAGQSLSGIGSMVSMIALPLVAVERLHASTFAVGLLEAMEWLPAVALGLLVGALVDRHQDRTKSVMMAANFGQALAVAAVPVSAVTGVLSLPVLLAAAAVAGCFTVFFQAGYSPYLRALIAPDELVIATSRLAVGRSIARVSGPSLGGVLVEAIGGAAALVADSASFAVSFLALAASRQPAPPTARLPPASATAPATRPLRRDVAAGLRHLRASPLLLAIAIATASANMFLTAIGAVEIVFLVRSVRVSPGVIGVLFAVGGIGGLAGAGLAGALCNRLGTATVARLALALTAPAALLIPLTHRGPTVLLFALAGLTVSFGIALASVAFASLRLLYCPPELLGRISAASRMLTSATIPVGALAGGGLGQLVGTRFALVLMASGYVCFGLILVRSPLRGTAA